MRITATNLLLAFLLAAPGISVRVGGEEPVDFDRDIRPLFSDSCFACHGPDRKARKARLRLDDAKLALKKAIVPYKPDESPLMERLLSRDEDERMPPADSNRPRLSAAEVDLVRRWIRQGAKFDEHWAYRAPQRPSTEGRGAFHGGRDITAFRHRGLASF